MGEDERGLDLPCERASSATVACLQHRLCQTLPEQAQDKVHRRRMSAHGRELQSTACESSRSHFLAEGQRTMIDLTADEGPDRGVERTVAQTNY